MSETPVVVRNDALCRVTMSVDNKEAGFVSYEEHDGYWDLVHTEVSPDFRGQGLSSSLIRGALDAAREAGKAWRPTCSAVAHFIEKNPDYQAGVYRG